MCIVTSLSYYVLRLVLIAVDYTVSTKHLTLSHSSYILPIENSSSRWDFIMRAYSTRNSFYLRISKNIVLPIYIYLDERHVNWMSDKVLQHVLSDLRPHILPKLKIEADSLTGSTSAQKQATVDTHRGGKEIYFDFPNILSFFIFLLFSR
ncbi:hypothetical protein BDZ97DRAFT_24566 [Flammula alnicola]|nr:hypothetical protein BDZ97DRAFT_24566 [Flammula alnicola]